MADDEQDADFAEAFAAVEAKDRRVDALRRFIQRYESDADLRFIDVVTTYEAGDGRGAGQLDVFAVPGFSSPVALTHEALTVLLGPRQACELAQALLDGLRTAEVDVTEFDQARSLDWLARDAAAHDLCEATAEPKDTR